MPSALRAFLALVWFSLGRQGKVRQMGWVGFALLGVCVLVVAVVSHSDTGWRIENRQREFLQLQPGVPSKDQRDAFRGLTGVAAVVAVEAEKPETGTMTYREYARERLTMYQALPGPPDEFGMKAAAFAAFKLVVAEKEALTVPETPTQLDEPDNGSPRLPAPANPLQEDYALANFSRVVVGNLFLAFLLPLFTLAYGSAGVGSEREARTLLWLFTRPLPRWAVYLAKWLGGLPWCVGACALAFEALCLAGGELGQRAGAAYWPTVLGGAAAFGCVFHMVGALFRWPTVVGLVYVFFFETLVGLLPGGLKQFSLNYYLRSLFYNRLTAVTPTVRPESLDTYQPAEPGTAWLVLTVVAMVVTVLGAWLFARQEPKDET